MSNQSSWPVLKLRQHLNRQDMARLQPSQTIRRRESEIECTIFVKHAPLSRLHADLQSAPHMAANQDSAVEAAHQSPHHKTKRLRRGPGAYLIQARKRKGMPGQTTIRA